MKKFNLTALVTVSAQTTIEADTLDEAIEKASKRTDMMSIVTNNGDTADYVWMVEDLDGTPFKIREDN